jgi:peptidoglycan pentaglycine glycine transferase (the first glycine)
MYEIHEIDDHEQWNTFVAGTESGHIQQSFEWSVLNKSLDPLRVGVIADGRLVAAALVTTAAVPRLGLRWLYVSRGPVIADPQSPALGALFAYLHGEARRRGAVMLRVEPNALDGDSRWLAALRGLGLHPSIQTSQPRRTWVLDIRPDEQRLLANMKRNWRYNISLGERKGVQVRPAASEADLDAWYQLYRETSVRDDFVAVPREHYAAMLRLYGDHARLFLAEYEGTLLAGRLVVAFGRWGVDIAAATSEQHRQVKANYPLQWQAIRWARERGCAWYDFRGIPEVLEPGEETWNVYEYKRGFGGESRLHLATHDYIYRPALYWPLAAFSAYRHNRRRAARRKLELERAARSRQSGSEARGGDSGVGEEAGIEPQRPPAGTTKDTGGSQRA